MQTTNKPNSFKVTMYNANDEKLETLYFAAESEDAGQRWCACLNTYAPTRRVATNAIIGFITAQQQHHPVDETCTDNDGVTTNSTGLLWHYSRTPTRMHAHTHACTRPQMLIYSFSFTQIHVHAHSQTHTIAYTRA